MNQVYKNLMSEGEQAFMFAIKVDKRFILYNFFTPPKGGQAEFI